MRTQLLEGRNLILYKIAECFKGKEGVRLLDYSSDEDHNRSVFTIIGEPEKLRDAVIASCEVALNSIDLRKHKGQHPRMGAVDVIPFIPIKNCSIKDADDIAKQVGKYLGEVLNQPVYLYEKSATNAARENLADIRRVNLKGF